MECTGGADRGAMGRNGKSELELEVFAAGGSARVERLAGQAWTGDWSNELNLCIRAV